MKNNIFVGFHYLTQGASLLTQKGIRRFVFIPLLANLVVFILLSVYLFQNFSAIQLWFSSLLPPWQWLAYIATFLSALVMFFILLIYGYSFTILTNLIAAPFYGLLAEKIELRVSNNQPPPETMQQMVIRTFKRELVKLFYFISRGLLVIIGLFFLSFIPLLNLLVPFIGILWGAWVMTLQYVDYPADNHQLSFTGLRSGLKHQRFSSIGFGSTIMFCSMIPVINIFIMPIAVAGGTLFWVNELQPEGIKKKELKKSN